MSFGCDGSLPTRKTLAGFTSRWTMLTACAAASADATCLARATDSESDKGARSRRAWRSSPSSHSIARYGSCGLEQAVSDITHHVRVVDRREDLCLTHEPLAVLRRCARSDFDRNKSTTYAITAAVNNAEPAAPRDRLDVEPTGDLRRLVHTMSIPHSIFSVRGDVRFD